MKEYEISATMEDDLCSVDILLFILASNKRDAIKKAKKKESTKISNLPAMFCHPATRINL